MNKARSKGRHLLSVEVQGADFAALRAVAKRDDVTVSQLVRRGVRHVLAAERGEAAPPAGGSGPEDRHARRDL
jgi:hypothetical protein